MHAVVIARRMPRVNEVKGDGPRFMEGLRDLLNTIQGRLQKGRFDNEQSVREALVLPILRRLGWDDADPDTVIREYSMGQRRVDYGLATGSNSAEAIIEVKSPGHLIDADRQLFEYAFHGGVPFAVLTDGREWHFFLPGEHGTYSERRAYKLDLTEREADQAAHIFHRYLEFDRFRSGQALDDARRDYRDRARKREAEANLPKAWSEIVHERDEILLDLIAEKTESLCGIRPDLEMVEGFVARSLEQSREFEIHERAERGKRRQQQGLKAPHRKETTTRQAERSAASEKGQSRTRANKGSREITYELLGYEHTARNAKEALLKILQELARDDPRFFERLAPRVKTRQRNHIAARKEDVYPSRPDLADHATEIRPGWWIGLNIANREKRRILERACDVAGLTFGEDLKIDLPPN